MLGVVFAKCTDAKNCLGIHVAIFSKLRVAPKSENIFSCQHDHFGRKSLKNCFTRIIGYKISSFSKLSM